jgi:hypothetical protein
MALITVKVNPGVKLSELGAIYVGGQTFQTTEVRARQLSGLVTVLDAPKPAAPPANRQMTPDKIEVAPKIVEPPKVEAKAEVKVEVKKVDPPKPPPPAPAPAPAK